MFTSRRKGVRSLILAFMLRYQEEHGTFPSVREIQGEFKFASLNSVHRHLKALSDEGSLKRVGRRARAFELRGRKPRRVIRVPLLGTIPAGLPESAFTEAEETIAVDQDRCRVSGMHRLFALRVRGDSMTGASIRDGDIAILEDRPTDVGDIVAALVDGEVTLKRLVRVRSRRVLRADNPKYKDIIPQTDLQVQGVLVCIQRMISKRLSR